MQYSQDSTCEINTADETEGINKSANNFKTPIKIFGLYNNYKTSSTVTKQDNQQFLIQKPQTMVVNKPKGDGFF